MLVRYHRYVNDFDENGQRRSALDMILICSTMLDVTAQSPICQLVFVPDLHSLKIDYESQELYSKKVRSNLAIEHSFALHCH